MQIQSLWQIPLPYYSKMPSLLFFSVYQLILPIFTITYLRFFSKFGVPAYIIWLASTAKFFGGLSQGSDPLLLLNYVYCSYIQFSSPHQFFSNCNNNMLNVQNCHSCSSSFSSLSLLHKGSVLAWTLFFAVSVPNSLSLLHFFFSHSLLEKV